MSSDSGINYSSPLRSYMTDTDAECLQREIYDRTLVLWQEECSGANDCYMNQLAECCVSLETHGYLEQFQAFNQKKDAEFIAWVNFQFKAADPSMYFDFDASTHFAKMVKSAHDSHLLWKHNVFVFAKSRVISESSQYVQ